MKKMMMVLMLFITLGACAKGPDYNTYVTQSTFTMPTVMDNDLGLPTSVSIQGVRFDVSWQSSHPSIVSDSGEILVTVLASDTLITLSATVTKEGFTKTLHYPITVLSRQASS